MFGSDNQAPAHPNVLAAMLEANAGRASSYGGDSYSDRALAAVHDVFETRDLDIYLVGTGGAANGLGLSLLCPPWAAIACHHQAHVLTDEGGGPELFTQGARLIPIGDDTHITPQDLIAVSARHPSANVHSPQVRAVTVTNLTEQGLVYQPDALGALSEVCRAQNWGLHMDGARFANAMVSTGASAADLSWRNGVDVLSFGLTKTGALCAEALIVFGKARTANAAYLRKRAGQLFSKQRFLAAQMVAMLDQGLWLSLASHANEMTKGLAQVLKVSGCPPIHPVEGNEVFVRLPATHVQALQAAGITLYSWPALGPDAHRFVASWQTTLADIDAVRQVLTGSQLTSSARTADS